MSTVLGTTRNSPPSTVPTREPVLSDSLGEHSGVVVRHVG